MPALKSLDKSGRVIYVGSLAKSLAPALRLGYIVAPQCAGGRTAPAAPRDGAPPQRLPAAEPTPCSSRSATTSRTRAASTS
jgi:hypothetical protein